MKEEIVKYLISKQGPEMYPGKFLDRIITRKTDEEEVKDYKQGEYKYKYDDSEHKYVNKMNEKLPVFEIEKKYVKHGTEIDFFTYRPFLLINKKFTSYIYKLDGKFSLFDSGSDNKANELKNLYDEDNLYYQETLNLKFNSSDEKQRKKLFEETMKKIKPEYKKGIFDISVEKILDIVPDMAAYLKKDWRPVYKLKDEDILKYRISEWIKYKSWQLKMYEILSTGSREEDIKYDYKKHKYILPDIYTLQRIYYKNVEVEKNTIASRGCLIACYADIITYYGNEQTPTQVDEKMDKMNKDYEAGIPGAKSGYAEGSADMIMDNVAEEYGFEYGRPMPKELDKPPKEDNADESSELFLKKIKERIEKNQPTIVRLYSKDAGQHFVVIVGLRYVPGNEEPIAYIINDPGRGNKEYEVVIDGEKVKKPERFTIDRQTRIYEHKNRKIVQLLFLDEK